MSKAFLPSSSVSENQFAIHYDASQYTPQKPRYSMTVSCYPALALRHKKSNEIKQLTKSFVESDLFQDNRPIVVAKSPEIASSEIEPWKKIYGDTIDI